jgi:hypothetical protein
MADLKGTRSDNTVPVAWLSGKESDVHHAFFPFLNPKAIDHRQLEYKWILKKYHPANRVIKTFPFNIQRWISGSPQ